MRLETRGILSSSASFFWGSFSWILMRNMAHSRGTEMKTVGRQRLTSSMKVSRDSGKAMVAPLNRLPP
ncbi:hypothetical protein D3C76_384060 [compost metagenome]